MTYEELLSKYVTACRQNYAMSTVIDDLETEIKDLKRELREVTVDFDSANLKPYPPLSWRSNTMSNVPRPLYVIAKDINKAWPKPYFGAVPYIDAMRSLDSIKDSYMYDSAVSIVRYFLANANTWRGEEARKIKAELKSQLEGVTSR